jgi:hypothetical protein
MLPEWVDPRNEELLTALHLDANNALYLTHSAVTSKNIFSPRQASNPAVLPMPIVLILPRPLTSRSVMHRRYNNRIQNFNLWSRPHGQGHVVHRARWRCCHRHRRGRCVYKNAVGVLRWNKRSIVAPGRVGLDFSSNYKTVRTNRAFQRHPRNSIGFLPLHAEKQIVGGCGLLHRWAPRLIQKFRVHRLIRRHRRHNINHQRNTIQLQWAERKATMNAKLSVRT